ncbi:MAG: hypothetical protein V3V16_08305 [Melioribacteraceae bacterium]
MTHSNKIIFRCFFSLLFFLVFLLSCSENNSIDKEILAKTYVDILVAEEYYKNIDSINIEKEKVFKKYSIDTASYYSTLKSFSSDKESWNDFFKLANTYLDTLKANVKSSTLKIEQL